MNTILNWSLEPTIVVSVLFVFYFLCFRNNTSLNLRRRLMLFILIISVLAPLIKVDVSNTNEWSESSLVTLDDRIFESVLVRESSDIDQLEATDSTIITQARSKDYKLLIYQIGIVAFACMFLSQLIRLGYILFTGNKDHIHGTLLVKHKKIKSPSSFLFAILLSENQNLNAKESDIIIEHEKQHLKQKHSVDLLLVSIIQILTWYNPLLFWIRSELKNLHEALADKAVLETIDNKEYFQTLLASTFSIHSLSLSHCFSQKHGLLKRIHLIKK